MPVTTHADICPCRAVRCGHALDPPAPRAARRARPSCPSGPACHSGPVCRVVVAARDCRPGTVRARCHGLRRPHVGRRELRARRSGCRRPGRRPRSTRTGRRGRPRPGARRPPDGAGDHDWRHRAPRSGAARGREGPTADENPRRRCRRDPVAARSRWAGRPGAARPAASSARAAPRRDCPRATAGGRRTPLHRRRAAGGRVGAGFCARRPRTRCPIRNGCRWSGGDRAAGVARRPARRGRVADDGPSPAGRAGCGSAARPRERRRTGRRTRRVGLVAGARRRSSRRAAGAAPHLANRHAHGRDRVSPRAGADRRTRRPRAARRIGCCGGCERRRAPRGRAPRARCRALARAPARRLPAGRRAV